MEKSEWKVIRAYNILNQIRLDKNATLLAYIMHFQNVMIWYQHHKHEVQVSRYRGRKTFLIDLDLINIFR